MSMSLLEFGQFLRDIREKLGYSTYDVNKLCDISPSYLSLLETGKRKPSAIILKKIAPIYNLDYIDLYEKAGYVDLAERERLEEQRINNYINLFDITTTSIPILGTVKAGYDYLAQENWIGSVDIEKSIVGNGKDYFALKIHGDSMSPVLVEDDIVLVKKQDDFENGDIIVAIINGDEATIKKGKKSDTSVLLQPLNTKYEPLIFTKDEMKSIPVKIIGIVKQLKREF
ncbi:MAG: S24 family peptidase [Clostridia bacterium]|nr:S24 family peptidase [Clostridia bacterium]